MPGMDESRKKPDWAFWTTVVVVTLVAYPLSWKPACWINMKLGGPDWLEPAFNFYMPLVWAVDYGPDWVKKFFDFYSGLFGLPWEKN